MIGVAGVIKQRLDGQQQQRLDGQPGPLRRTLLHLRPPVKQLDLRRCATARSRAGEKAREGVERCCRRAGHGDGLGHDYDKKRRERVVSRILLLMARPGQTTGPLFRPALRGHGESAPSEHAMRILTLRSPSVAQGQWRRGSRMGLRGAVDAQGLAPGCAGARARRRPCQQLGCPSSRGLSPRSAGRPGPGQARRALPLGGAACDGTSGRAVGRADDAIWWALHGLRCSSGAYAHI